jgi:hypothetical protein
MGLEKSTPTIRSDEKSFCEESSWVTRFYRGLPRSVKVMLLFSTVSFMWLEAECVSGIWLMMHAHVQLRHPWLYILVIFLPWGFCIRALWLVGRMLEGQSIEGRHSEGLMVLVAAVPFCAYFLLCYGIGFASVVAKTRFTLPFF